MNILIVEDQMGPLWAIAQAVEKIGGENTIHNAKWYTQAEQMVLNYNYDVILLDHNMPKEKGLPENIGYGLIPIILKKNKKTVIIGTSLMPESGIRSDGYTLPEFKLAKGLAINRDLTEIITKLQDKGRLPSS
jgi:CheY-like chemotaxis protein